jgi:Spy/CpxP family protein refolding chaperone
MSRTMNMLVAVALVVGGAWEARASQPQCDPLADQLSDAISGECPAPAQGGGTAQSEQKRSHKWWLAENSRAEFGITDQQSRDLEAVFQQMLPTLKTNKANLDREEKALSQLLGAASASEPAVIQAIERVESARGALSRTRTLMLYRMYRLLSSEQRAKVQAYHERKSQEGNRLSTRR